VNQGDIYLINLDPTIRTEAGKIRHGLNNFLVLPTWLQGWRQLQPDSS
jgi:hypothetical protein